MIGGACLLNILLRTVIVYTLLIIAMRIGGKRQIGQLQLSELVSALLISELAAMPIGHEEIPLTFSVIPIIAIICIEIIAAFAVTKSKKLRTLFDGKPSVIIEKGVVNFKEMERLRLGIEELIVEARLKGVADISELDYAILEDNGELSVFKKSETQSGIAHVIIADGQINTKGLDTVKMSKKALRTRLKSKNVAVCDVFLYTVDDSGKEFLIKKEGK